MTRCEIIFSTLRGCTGGGGSTFVAVVKVVVRGTSSGTGALSEDELSDENWDKKLRSRFADDSVGGSGGC